MKTNVKLISTKTYVNRDKRSVTVVNKYALDIFAIKNFVGSAAACSEISNYVKDSIIPVGIFDYKDSKLILTVSGTSKCMKTDKFNEKIGFRIADTRAQVKAMNIVSKFYEGLYNVIYTNLLDDIKDKFYNCRYAYFSCREHERKLLWSINN